MNKSVDNVRITVTVSPEVKAELDKMIPWGFGKVFWTNVVEMVITLARKNGLKSFLGSVLMYEGGINDLLKSKDGRPGDKEPEKDLL